MATIIIRPFLLDKMEELIKTLYRKKYFSYYENAEMYVDAIKDFIYTIPTRKSHRTLDTKHGKYYCMYKPNRHTAWFITFDTDGETWLVKNIFNNHTEDYPTFIRSEG